VVGQIGRDLVLAVDEVPGPLDSRPVRERQEVLGGKGPTKRSRSRSSASRSGCAASSVTMTPQALCSNRPAGTTWTWTSSCSVRAPERH
jgi:hypothetical protein